MARVPMNHMRRAYRVMLDSTPRATRGIEKTPPRASFEGSAADGRGRGGSGARGIRQEDPAAAAEAAETVTLEMKTLLDLKPVLLQQTIY